jgi:hypothetical protein
MSKFTYYIIAAAFIFAVFLFEWFLQRDMKKVRGQFNRKDIIIASYGVRFYGLESEPGGPLNSGGQMLFLKSGLYYKGRFDKRELFIPRESILSIAVTDFHKGEPTIGKCLAFYFTDKNGKIDRAAFELPYPKQWVDAIRLYAERENKNIPVKEEYIE